MKRNAASIWSSRPYVLTFSLVGMGAMGAYFSLAVGDLLHLDGRNGVLFLLLVVFGLATYPVVHRVVRYVALWESQRRLPYQAGWRLIAFFLVFGVSLLMAQVEAQQPLGMAATGWHVGISVAWMLVSLCILPLPARPLASMSGPVGADCYLDDDIV